MVRIIPPPWGTVLGEELKRWEKFQDALRLDERLIFQDMMDECVRRTSDAAATGFLASSKLMFLSVLFAHEKTLRELRGKIEQITRATGEPAGGNECNEKGKAQGFQS